jgi:hypothetical protein
MYRYQPGLGQSQCQCAAGTHQKTRRFTCRGVEPRWDIQGEHLRGFPVAQVDELGCPTTRRPAQAVAHEGIYNDVGPAERFPGLQIANQAQTSRLQDAKLVSGRIVQGRGLPVQD